MFSSAVHAGISAIRKRPGLGLLLFGVNAVLAYVVASPVGSALNSVFGPTGFGAETGPLSVVLLADFFERDPSAVGTLFGLIFLMIPLLAVWSTASGVGLTHALRDGAVRPFWDGVTSFMGRGLGITGLFLVQVLVWSGLSLAGGLILTLAWKGEVGSFWTWAVIVPTVWITGLAFLDMVQDYARIGLVTRGLGVFASVFFGWGFVLRRGAPHGLYLVWFIPAAALTLVPGLIETGIGVSLGVFLLQQVFLVGRAMTSVGWVGSQVRLAEEVANRAAPLIAGDSAAEGTGNGSDVLPATIA